MTDQLPLDFNAHASENNGSSKRHLEKNRDRFNAKCAEVYRRLMAGERLTVLACANTGISSLPRRILDLKERGVEISDEWHEVGATKIKRYFCSHDDLGKNRFNFRHDEERAA